MSRPEVLRYQPQAPKTNLLYSNHRCLRGLVDLTLGAREASGSHARHHLRLTSPALARTQPAPAVRQRHHRTSRRREAGARRTPRSSSCRLAQRASPATPRRVARAFTSVADRVITHPNVMNGAQLYWSDPALHYVEGYALDQFAAGKWGLRPVTSQRVGLLLDEAIEPDLKLRHLQAADACRATLGINGALAALLCLLPAPALPNCAVTCLSRWLQYVVTDEPLGVRDRHLAGGCLVGHAAQPRRGRCARRASCRKRVARRSPSSRLPRRRRTRRCRRRTARATA